LHIYTFDALLLFFQPINYVVFETEAQEADYRGNSKNRGKQNPVPPDHGISHDGGGENGRGAGKDGDDHKTEEGKAAKGGEPG
jgi:hypothetical protein